jgi:hypothetical protein
MIPLAILNDLSQLASGQLYSALFWLGAGIFYLYVVKKHIGYEADLRETGGNRKIKRSHAAFKTVGVLILFVGLWRLVAFLKALR